MKLFDKKCIITVVILLLIVIAQFKYIRDQTRFIAKLEKENASLLLQIAAQHPGCRLFREVFPEAEANVIKGIVELRDSPSNAKYVCDYVPWVTNVVFRRAEGSALMPISQQTFLKEVNTLKETEQGPSEIPSKAGP